MKTKLVLVATCILLASCGRVEETRSQETRQKKIPVHAVNGNLEFYIARSPLTENVTN